MLGMLALPCFSSTPSMEELRRASGGLCFFESSGMASVEQDDAFPTQKFSEGETREMPATSIAFLLPISLRKKSCARV